MRAESNEFRRLPRRQRSRTRQIDLDDLFDTTGIAGHDRHPVRKQNSFIDAVRNEQDCFSGLRPDSL